MIGYVTKKTLYAIKPYDPTVKIAFITVSKFMVGWFWCVLLLNLMN